jgi:lysyl endopeptidase
VFSLKEVPLMLRRLPYAFVLCLALSPAAAIEIDAVLLPDTAAKAASPPALRLAESVSLVPLAALRPASAGAVDQLEAIAAWNRSGAVPAKNGFPRPLPLPRAVRFSAELLKSQPARLAGGALLAPPAGGLVWAAEVRAEASSRLRLHLSDVQLPPGTRIWVYGEGTAEEVSVAAEDILHEGEIWTPSVAGPAIRLEVRLPENGLDGARFTVDQVLELFELDAEGAPRDAALQPKGLDTSCIQDAACFGTAQLATLDIQKKAVALLEFVDGGQGFLCSGALLNDTDAATTIPYLLTAHHCFDTQASASTLEAFFDFIDQSCNGSAPSQASVPRTNGATLLATGAASDFTFVRLSSLPAGRGLLGSTNEAVTDGAVLHRISHPLGQPMRYTRSEMDAGPLTCSDIPRTRFIYSFNNLGGTFGGSSGSALTRADGRVVGQLLGSCGFNPEEGCDPSNDDVDGALAFTWPAISAWLTPPNPDACTPGPSTLCLNGDRFKVEATFQTVGGLPGTAQAVELTEETGYLWFFAATNVEVVIKILDACTFNQRFWVYAGGLTDVQVVITVTDTETGAVKTYTNPQSTKFQPITDSSAFDTCL